MNTIGYSKLAASILTSTIWVESDQTLRVWVTILALKDKNGFVSGTMPGIANIARVSLQDCQNAFSKFLAPDPYSRTKDNEGRRLTETEDGWMVLNHHKYRNDRDLDARREQTRRAVAKHRKLKKNVSNGKPTVSNGNARKAHTDTDTDTDLNTIPPPALIESSKSIPPCPPTSVTPQRRPRTPRQAVAECAGGNAGEVSITKREENQYV